MLRALELATLGRGHVSPNPMVGCVIVHGPEGKEKIIGEGWHQHYGEAHAERNAILSVRPEDRALLPASTLYVTLEPCSHWGKQPPCADLLIENRVKRVICCNDDPNPLVAGQGFARLRAAGIEVETGFLNELGRDLNARFFTFFEKKRPYIILKWAQTSDGFMAGEGGQPVKISGDLAHRLVHRWRSEEDAIMVGTNTARTDNPRLNVRLVSGKNPTRIVIDKQLQLDPNLNLFDNSQPTLGYNFIKTETIGQTSYIQLQPDKPFLPQLLDDLYQRRIQSVLVEGGTTLIESFVEVDLWDEMRVFRSPMLLSQRPSASAVKAPVVRGRLVSQDRVGKDEFSIYRPSFD